MARFSCLFLKVRELSNDRIHQRIGFEDVDGAASRFCILLGHRPCDQRVLLSIILPRLHTYASIPRCDAPGITISFPHMINNFICENPFASLITHLAIRASGDLKPLPSLSHHELQAQPPDETP